MFFTKKDVNTFTVAFYNVENLFDTIDNPNTLDDEFTSVGKKKWTDKRYQKKIKKLGSVISQLGTYSSTIPPAIIGLVEVENVKVVADLANSSNLKKHHYGIVHYDSPDERGIDVALLYNKQVFEFIDSETHAVYLEDDLGNRDYTRDILKVSGFLKGELIHILVNHWSSRRAGANQTEHKRIKAAETARNIINTIKEKEIDPKIIIMGDFNDNPTSKSVKQHLVKSDFFNPMESLLAKGRGTIAYKGEWNLFDQIIFSNNFLEKNEKKIYFKYAEVFNKKWIRVLKGKLKGSPFRTYLGKWYQGGFSDHFPVYAFLRKKN